MRALLLAVLVATAIGGCGSSQNSRSISPAVTPAASQVQASPRSVILGNVYGKTFKDIRLAGKSNQIAKFKIPKGAVAIAVATHAGIGHFAIVALDKTGQQTGLLVNTLGHYQGTTLFDLEDFDSVAFRVTADGAWTIVVKPVGEAPVWDPTTQLGGTGDGVFVVSPARDEPETVNLTYRGNGTFTVNAITASSVDLVANETGNFSGQVQLPDTTILLDVQANGGAWIASPA